MCVFFDGRHVEEDAHEGEGDHELTHENGVHLTNEAIPDRFIIEFKLVAIVHSFSTIRKRLSFVNACHGLGVDEREEVLAAGQMMLVTQYHAPLNRN